MITDVICIFIYLKIITNWYLKMIIIVIKMQMCTAECLCKNGECAE